MLSLPSLPNEILSSVVSHLEEPEDRKDFRLVCSACEPIPLPFLFRRIGLSRVKRDKDAFEQIAARPHLAQYVRQLVWYELHLEGWVSDNTTQCGLEDDGYDSIRQLLIDAIHDPELFWIPSSDQQSGDQVDAPRIVRDYRPHFFRLLGQMPNLRTFASCPMFGDQQIMYKDYPLTADLFLFTLDHDSWGDNEGFLSFLMPAMERPESTITDLRLSERRIHLSSIFQPTFKSLLSADAFRALTSIDLSLNYSTKTRFSEAHAQTVHDNSIVLASCLQAAKGLQHLALRFDELLYRHNRLSTLYGCYSSLVLEIIVKESHWPQLTSVHLQSMPGFLKDGFREFLRNHAANLRSLSFEDCLVTQTDLQTLRSLNLLQLTSLEIICRCPESWSEEEEEGTLLAYLNHTTATCDIGYGDLAVESHPGETFATRYTFTHRDGTTVIGEEPLDYFSDWDSDDDANTAEPYESESETESYKAWSRAGKPERF